MHDEEANMFDPPMDAMSYEDELRAKLDDAERLVEVLKAECRAWREMNNIDNRGTDATTKQRVWRSVKDARDATDALLAEGHRLGEGGLGP